MNIVFMGSPDFALPALEALIHSKKHTVVAVFSQPPKPAGRGHHLTPTPVHQLAESHGIPVYTPEKLRDDEIETLEKLAPEAIVVAAYGLLLPEGALNVAPCLNIHPSALPRWRGAAPINHTLLAGDKETDVCIMHMEKGLDSGPVYLREHVRITPNETAGDLHDRLAQVGARLLLQVLDKWGKWKPVPQPANMETTYAHKFKGTELNIIRPTDFTLPAQEVHNHIRGLSPWPGATATHRPKEGAATTLKLLRSELAPLVSVPENSYPGDILFADKTHGIVVACGDGQALRIRQLQRPGRPAAPDVDFLNGYTPFQAGGRLA